MQVVRNSCLASLFVVVVAAAACGQTQTNASAQTDTPAQSPRTRSAPAQTAPGTSGQGLVLEFDVPDEFATPAGSANLVTGFRVGFFRPKEATPVRTVDVPRGELTVQGTTAQITVSREGLQECGRGCTVKIQTVSNSLTSAWSEPASPSTPTNARRPPPAPSRSRAARPERPANAPNASAARRRGISPEDVERYPALSEALRTVLPKDASLEAEVKRFRRIEELAIAVALSRDHDIPFTTLAKALEGPPRVPPRVVLTKLRQDLDALAVIRKSRAEAQRLIASAQEGARSAPPR